ncbi:hypothetical protein ZIOFF_071638 [Zingiber officinale]|uniref:Uncharacterized protein n=1 Tax=Zingiber officinale TaxID=94328 RepID=A0A8J5EUI5_ZINOF|nr:hypothetical protein ZIOFF_071638 [Zingiber officinale]
MTIAGRTTPLCLFALVVVVYHNTYITLHCRTTARNVQQQMQEMRQQNQLEMQEMRSMFLQSMRQQNHPEQIASGDICSDIGNDFGSNSDINIGAKNSGGFGHSFQSNLRNVSRGDICANTKCKLLHWLSMN